MKFITRLALGAALCASAVLAHAETPADVKALLEAAVSEVKAKGVEGAAKEFNAGGKWKQGQMYLVMANFDGLMLAHSANDKMAGKNMFEAKDASGKEFVKATIAAVKGSGAGEVDIRWGNPTTKQIADAVMYSRRVPGADAYVGTVVFK